MKFDITRKKGITAPLGFFAGAAACGIKKPSAARLDLACLKSDNPAHVAGMLTRNAFAAAPVKQCRTVLEGGLAQAVIVNSGNANAATGARGMKDSFLMARMTAKALGVKDNHVLTASTGTIGVPLPMNRIARGISECAGAMKRGSAADRNFASSIMTTDTFRKQVSIRAKIGHTEFTLGAAVKGSGMIMPDMATMLAFFTCDATVPSAVLKRLLAQVTADTFNALTVDGDTSTNDTAIIMANGMAGTRTVRSKADIDVLRQVISEAAHILVRDMAKDGEGATRTIIVQVTGAKSRDEADLVARRIANSPLVKTAVFGADPNWGRIIAAAGAALWQMDENRLKVWIQNKLVCSRGRLREIPGGKQLLKKPEITIRVDLGRGKASRRIFTCDLTDGYIRINASYRT